MHNKKITATLTTILIRDITKLPLSLSDDEREREKYLPVNVFPSDYKWSALLDINHGWGGKQITGKICCINLSLAVSFPRMSFMVAHYSLKNILHSGVSPNYIFQQDIETKQCSQSVIKIFLQLHREEHGVFHGAVLWSQSGITWRARRHWGWRLLWDA